jgi:hypothetical protein
MAFIGAGWVRVCVVNVSQGVSWAHGFFDKNTFAKGIFEIV